MYYILNSNDIVSGSALANCAHHETRLNQNFQFLNVMKF